MKYYFVFPVKRVTSAAGDHVFIPIQHIPHWTAKSKDIYTAAFQFMKHKL